MGQRLGVRKIGALFVASPVFEIGNPQWLASSPLMGSLHSDGLFSVQKHHMSTPRIRLKVDRTLDAAAIRDYKLKPIFKIRDFILKQEEQVVKLRHLNVRSENLGLQNKRSLARGYIKRFPNIFEIFAYPGDHSQPWVRLSKAVMELVDEEAMIYREREEEVVWKLRKLLMMSKTRRIRVGKLEFSRRCLGLPRDFVTRVALSYPQYFRVVSEGTKTILELVEWDESLAVSAFEKERKEEARNAGLGEIETRGQPLSFQMEYSPGMFLRKKNLEILERWQKLPYTSPYQECSWLKPGTSLFDKRAVAVLHEILSLTVEKKALMMTIGRFNEEFGLPQSAGKVIRRFPGIFYLSLKGDTETVILRGGYDGAELLEDHPLLHIKNKYIQMFLDGPKLRASGQVIQFEEEEEEDKEGLSEEGESDLGDSDFTDAECDDESDNDTRVKREIW